MKNNNIFSPNFSKNKRKIKSIKFIIIHYTGMQSERESLIRLCDPKFKVSCHFLICRNGAIYNLVKDGIITIPNDIAEEIINDPDYEFNVNKRQFYKMVKNAYVDNQHDDDDADKDDYKYYDREY